MYYTINTHRLTQTSQPPFHSTSRAAALFLLLGREHHPYRGVEKLTHPRERVDQRTFRPSERLLPQTVTLTWALSNRPPISVPFMEELDKQGNTYSKTAPCRGRPTTLATKSSLRGCGTEHGKSFAAQWNSKGTSTTQQNPAGRGRSTKCSVPTLASSS